MIVEPVSAWPNPPASSARRVALTYQYRIAVPAPPPVPWVFVAPNSGEWDQWKPAREVA